MTLVFWWQQIPLLLNPVVFTFSSFTLHWYGVFFLLGSWIAIVFLRKDLLIDNTFTKKSFEDFVFWFFVVILVGAKLGFLLLYWWPFVGISIPIQGFSLPGMSFFGGAIAGTLFLAWYAKKYQKNFWRLADSVVFYAPIAIFFGRLGNFFHVELWGRVTSMPWGMYFPGESSLRHPSALYAACLEGILLFSCLWFIRKQTSSIQEGAMVAWFAILYGIFRFLGEFFREPDIQIGYVLGMTFNQWLTVLLVGFGMYLLSTQSKKNRL